ncbi:MAG TPA: hypothetical protein VLH35_07200 [Candidatus Acidoferrales bacterium]|nr:hypothetical protein [Candidatus Acidoferrales bacterium]
MKTKLILAIFAVALVAAALVGVSAAQYVGAQNATNPILAQQVPPCADITGTVPSYCINATTGEPYYYQNGTYAGCCYNGNVNGYCGGGGCYGYGYGAQAQTQNQNQYGWGMMGQSGYGYGMGRCR